MLRQAKIYLSGEKKPALVAALHHNSAGILYEQEDSIVLTDWRDPVSLATSLRSALARFSLQDRNLRDHKKTDWPSYRASGCRSVKEFENTYSCIAVRALNEAELFYDAKCLPRNESDITLHVTLNRYGPDTEMGKLLLKLHDACNRWSTSAAQNEP